MQQIGNKVNLLICQKSKIPDWLEHFHTYYDWEVFDLTDKKQLTSFLQIRRGIGIINYELAFRRTELLKLEDFTLMLDESSLIQNEKAKRSKFILKLKPTSVILLSGTPTAGKYEKLWSQLRLLGWKIDKQAFWNSYVESEWIEVFGGYHREVVKGYKRVEHLKKKLDQHGAIFLKTSEVLDLPEQMEQVIYVEPSKLYKTFRKQQVVEFEWEGQELELVGDNTLTRMLYERQLCGAYSTDKLEAFRDLLESTEDRVIVFYNFNSELQQLIQIAEELEKPYGCVNGKERNLRPYEECENSVTFVQYQAGAMGLNCQKANRIIYYTLPLGKGSCDLWEQSKKRIHRINQTKSCFYYYIFVKDSIEEWNFDCLKEGKDLTDELFRRKDG